MNIGRTVARYSSFALSTMGVAIVAGLVALAVRLYFVKSTEVLQLVYEPKRWGDAAEYYRYAWHLFHQGIFSGDPIAAVNPRSDSYRDPAYPAFLAFWMWVTDSYERWYGLVILSQTLLGGMTVTFAVLAIRDALPRWLLVAGASTMVLWPHSVSFPAYMLSENLTAPLCALSAFALGEAARRCSVAYSVVGGVALATAGLTNAVLGPVGVLLALLFVAKRSMPRRQVAIFAVCALMPLLAWSVRNSTLPADAWRGSFRVEINLVQGSWPTYHTVSQLQSRNDPASTQTVDAINHEVWVLHNDRTKGLKLIFDRLSLAPGTYLAWYISKPALLWGWEIGLGAGDIYAYPTRHSPFMTNPLMKAVEAVTFIFNGVLAVLALIGVIVVALRRAPSVALIVFATIGTWVTLVYGVLQSDPRYSIPYRTGEIALACISISVAIDYLLKRRASRAGDPA